MATWRGLIESALIEINAVAEGQAVPAPQLNRAFSRLKLMLDSWQIDGLLDHSTRTISYEVTAPQAKYRIGPAAQDPDIVAEPRLSRIETLEYQNEGYLGTFVLNRINQRILSKIQYPEREYYPAHYYYDNSWPVGVLTFDVPTRNGDSFKLIGEAAIVPADITLDSEINLPAGYEETILCSMALKLAPSYGVQQNEISAETVRTAFQGKNMLRHRNVEPTQTVFDDLTGMTGGVRGSSGRGRSTRRYFGGG